MVNVITLTRLGVVAKDTGINISTYLEDRIAVLVSLGIRNLSSAPIAPPAVQTVDANRRMSPVPAGTTVAVNHARLTNWQTVTLGNAITTDNELVLTVLYLKDAGGVFP